jgi:hypothetical protein
MKAIGQWILLNPAAVKAYLVAVLALVAKGILAFTGKVEDLGQWSGFVDQAIDLVVGGLSIYGVIAGSIHTARGASLTPTDQAVAIVAALAPAPVPVPQAIAAIPIAAATVQQVVATVIAQKLPDPPPNYPMPSQRF